MSRLLHACARGARVAGLDKNYYFTEAAVGLGNLHPDDAHLQYGPISTALREMAENDSWCSGWKQYLALEAANEFTEYFDARQGEPDYPLFYLFLAEFLADEGM